VLPGGGQRKQNRMGKEMSKQKQVEDFIARTFIEYPLERDEDIRKRAEFKELLRQVLLSIWPRIKTRAEKIQSIHLAQISTAFPIPYSFYKRLADIWVIIFERPLVSGLGNGGEELRRHIRYIICHEFCHFYLLHGLIMGAGPRGEKEADILATEWGFPPPKVTDPKEKRSAWALRDEFKHLEEDVGKFHKRLVRQGIIKEPGTPGKEKAEAK